ncbi:hypothetical protein AALA82_00260 [Oscillospiraceae bacterium 50-16]
MRRARIWILAGVLCAVIAAVGTVYLLPRSIASRNGWGDTDPAWLTVGCVTGEPPFQWVGIDDSEALAPLIQLMRETKVSYRFSTNILPEGYLLYFRSAPSDDGLCAIYETIRVADGGYIYLGSRAYEISSDANRKIMEQLAALMAP